LTFILLVLIGAQTFLTIFETLSIRSEQHKIQYHDLDLIRSVSRMRAEYAIQLSAMQQISTLAQSEQEVILANWERACALFRSQGQLITQTTAEAGEQVERSEETWPEFTQFATHLTQIGQDLNRLDSGVLSISRLVEEGRQKEVRAMCEATLADAEVARNRIELLWQEALNSVNVTTRSTEQHARLLLLGWFALICLLGLAIAGIHYFEMQHGATSSTRTAVPPQPIAAG
jgi:hypothetical protein